MQKTVFVSLCMHGPTKTVFQNIAVCANAQ